MPSPDAGACHFNAAQMIEQEDIEENLLIVEGYVPHGFMRGALALAALMIGCSGPAQASTQPARAGDGQVQNVRFGAKPVSCRSRSVAAANRRFVRSPSPIRTGARRRNTQRPPASPSRMRRCETASCWPSSLGLRRTCRAITRP